MSDSRAEPTSAEPTSTGAASTGSDASSAGRFPWPPGGATGVGSMPGTDPAEAMRIVLGELPDLPHLAELPARGPGADPVSYTHLTLPTN